MGGKGVRTDSNPWIRFGSDDAGISPDARLAGSMRSSKGSSLACGPTPWHFHASRPNAKRKLHLHPRGVEALRPQQERLEALTGLRFVAAAAVFAVHLKDWVRTPAWNPGTMANAAVGFFFVLSGFILAHVYRREGKPVAATAFYRARFARIWPAHLVCLALAVAVNPHPEGGSTGGVSFNVEEDDRD